MSLKTRDEYGSLRVVGVLTVRSPVGVSVLVFYLGSTVVGRDSCTSYGDDATCHGTFSVRDPRDPSTL